MRLNMKLVRNLSMAALALGLALKPPSLAVAEDIDLFVAASSNTATRPNIMIVIDNSANWASASQHWDSSLKQGESELRALRSILNELDGSNPKVNIGLMMFTEGQGTDRNSAYVRFHMREMNTVNKNALMELIGTDTCVDGTNSLNGTPNCILKNFNGSEKTGTAKTDYSAALYEVYKYLGGYSSPAYATRDQQPPGALNDATHHGRNKYGGTASSYFDAAAYTDGTKVTYADWYANSCAKNYIVFIGNGFPVNTADVAGPYIANVNGGTSPLLPSQLSMQNFTTIASTTTTSLGNLASCTSSNLCVTNAQTTYGSLYDTYACTGGTASSFISIGTVTGCTSTTTAPTCQTTAATLFPGYVTGTYSCGVGSDSVASSATLGTDSVCRATDAECVTAAATLFPGYDSYSCSGGTGGCAPGSKSGRTITGSIAACTAGRNRTATAQCLVSQGQTGTKTVFAVTPLATFSTPTTSNARYTDEWASFLYTTDVSSQLGQQNASIYTIDVYKDQQDANESALLYNMAKYGGGKYFTATNENAIINALKEILIEIQSVNSVFASASLPINATNRSQNENQVFIGMFRPENTPRWYGNLKRYQIAKFGSDFLLGDASTPVVEAVSAATGFIQSCAKSFWTQDSGAYWFFSNGSAGNCTTSTLSVHSDAPDGPAVEKGAVAEVLRRGNNPPGTSGTLANSLDTSVTPSNFNVLDSSTTPPTVTSTNTFRNLYTCVGKGSANACCTSPATCSGATAADRNVELVRFNSTNVTKSMLGDSAMNDTIYGNVVNYTLGMDFDDKNQSGSATDTRPAIHGDVTHSRPLPVNYGGTTGVVLYYGANDGAFRAVQGSDGKELWAFLAPEQHDRLKRLADDSPSVLYPTATSGFTLGYDQLQGTTFFVAGETVRGQTSGATAVVTTEAHVSTTGTLAFSVAPTGTFSDNEEIRGATSDARATVNGTLVTGTAPSGAAAKDYFFDGSAGVYQTFTSGNVADQVYIYPTMRRGGRMLYAFNVSTPTTPALMWRVGCSVSHLTDTASCTSGFEQMGQTWSIPSVARIEGYETDTTGATPQPVVIVGAGYDTCEDQDAAPNTSCSATGYTRRGDRVYVIDAVTGTKVKEFTVSGSVASDVTLVSRNFRGYADQAYVATTTGNIYRIDFVNPTTPTTIRPSSQWTITRIGYTTGSDRKFLFGPAVLPVGGKAYVTITSGDRERPLRLNYPYLAPITNRAYMLIDSYDVTTDPTTGVVTGAATNLDGSSMADVTSSNTCATANPEDSGKKGWLFDLNNGAGEQGVTSSTIFSGLVFFSSNRPLASSTASCGNDLGEARGYAVNLLNASGAVGTQALCGGTRSGIFTGGGLPPSPVTGTVPVGGQQVTVMIGGINRGGGASSPIGAQRVRPSITQKRSRIYWYKKGDQ